MVPRAVYESSEFASTSATAIIDLTTKFQVVSCCSMLLRDGVSQHTLHSGHIFIYMYIYLHIYIYIYIIHMIAHPFT